MIDRLIWMFDFNCSENNWLFVAHMIDWCQRSISIVQETIWLVIDCSDDRLIWTFDFNWPVLVHADRFIWMSVSNCSWKQLTSHIGRQIDLNVRYQLYKQSYSELQPLLNKPVSQSLRRYHHIKFGGFTLPSRRTLITVKNWNRPWIKKSCAASKTRPLPKTQPLNKKLDRALTSTPSFRREWAGRWLFHLLLWAGR